MMDKIKFMLDLLFGIHSYTHSKCPNGDGSYYYCKYCGVSAWGLGRDDMCDG